MNLIVVAIALTHAAESPAFAPETTCLAEGYSCARCMNPCCCSGLVCDSSGPPKCMPAKTYTFAQWAAEHNKHYATPEEGLERAKNFERNLAALTAAQGKNPHAEFAPDEYADWSELELAGLRGLPCR